jgi:hypothetical protein
MTIPTLAARHALVHARSAKGLDSLLADNAVLYSPVVHAPQQGKAIAQHYLAAALRVFGNE